MPAPAWAACTKRESAGSNRPASRVGSAKASSKGEAFFALGVFLVEGRASAPPPRFRASRGIPVKRARFVPWADGEDAVPPNAKGPCCCPPQRTARTPSLHEASGWGTSYRLPEDGCDQETMFFRGHHVSQRAPVPGSTYGGTRFGASALPECTESGERTKYGESPGAAGSYGRFGHSPWRLREIIPLIIFF